MRSWSWPAEIAEETGAAIVAGDLNDVAWSHTSRLFRRISRLLDPRVGRGMYNTFHARYWPLRWPLDHVFVSDTFVLRRLQRLPAFGSDHFPVYIALDHAPAASAVQEAPAPDADDHAEAREKLARAGVPSPADPRRSIGATGSVEQAGAALQQLEQLAGRQRLREQIALHLIATVAAQQLELTARLDPFGDHLESQAFRQRDDCLRDRSVVRIGGDVLNEGLVDLERLDREALEVKQRRIAGAEVVDRQTDAEAIQRLQLGDRLLGGA